MAHKRTLSCLLPIFLVLTLAQVSQPASIVRKWSQDDSAALDDADDPIAWLVEVLNDLDFDWVNDWDLLDDIDFFDDFGDFMDFDDDDDDDDIKDDDKKEPDEIDNGDAIKNKVRDDSKEGVDTDDTNDEVDDDVDNVEAVSNEVNSIAKDEVNDDTSDETTNDDVDVDEVNDDNSDEATTDDDGVDEATNGDVDEVNAGNADEATNDDVAEVNDDTSDETSNDDVAEVNNDTSDEAMNDDVDEVNDDTSDETSNDDVDEVNDNTSGEATNDDVAEVNDNTSDEATNDNVDDSTEDSIENVDDDEIKTAALSDDTIIKPTNNPTAQIEAEKTTLLAKMERTIEDIGHKSPTNLPPRVITHVATGTPHQPPAQSPIINQMQKADLLSKMETVMVSTPKESPKSVDDPSSTQLQKTELLTKMQNAMDDTPQESPKVVDTPIPTQIQKKDILTEMENVMGDSAQNPKAVDTPITNEAQLTDALTETHNVMDDTPQETKEADTLIPSEMQKTDSLTKIQNVMDNTPEESLKAVDSPRSDVLTKMQTVMVDAAQDTPISGQMQKTDSMTEMQNVMINPIKDSVVLEPGTMSKSIKETVENQRSKIEQPSAVIARNEEPSMQLPKLIDENSKVPMTEKQTEVQPKESSSDDKQTKVDDQPINTPSSINDDSIVPLTVILPAVKSEVVQKPDQVPEIQQTISPDEPLVTSVPEKEIESLTASRKETLSIKSTPTQIKTEEGEDSTKTSTAAVTDLVKPTTELDVRPHVGAIVAETIPETSNNQPIETNDQAAATVQAADETIHLPIVQSVETAPTLTVSNPMPQDDTQQSPDVIDIPIKTDLVSETVDILPETKILPEISISDPSEIVPSTDDSTVGEINVQTSDITKSSLIETSPSLAVIKDTTEKTSGNTNIQPITSTVEKKKAVEDLMLQMQSTMTNTKPQNENPTSVPTEKSVLLSKMKGEIASSTKSVLLDQMDSTITDSKKAVLLDQMDSTIADSKKAVLLDQMDSTIADSKKSGLLDQIDSTITDSKKSVLLDQMNSTIVESKKSDLLDKMNSTIAESKKLALLDQMDSTIKESKKSVLLDQMNSTITQSKKSELLDQMQSTMDNTKATAKSNDGPNEPTQTEMSQDKSEGSTAGEDEPMLGEAELNEEEQAELESHEILLAEGQAPPQNFDKTSAYKNAILHTFTAWSKLRG